MRIKVYPGLFCDTALLDEDGFMDINEGAVVADLLNLLKYPLPMRLLKLYLVNYERAELHTPLKDGDIVSIITPMAGG